MLSNTGKTDHSKHKILSKSDEKFKVDILGELK